jgi:Yip1-like protein
MRQQLKALARLTVQDPRAAAAGLLSDKEAAGQAMPLAIIVVILGVFLSFAQSMIIPVRTDTFASDMLQNPLLLAVIQFMGLMISVIAILVIGRMFGGRGNFEQTLLLSVWLQFFMLIVQVPVILIAVVAAPIGNLLNTAAVFFFLYLTISFVAELHGFRSRMKVLGGFIFATIGASFLILFVLRMAGFNIEGV